MIGLGASLWSYVIHLPGPTILIYGMAAVTFSLLILEELRRFTFRRPSFCLRKYDEVLLGISISAEQKVQNRKVTIRTHPYCQRCNTEMDGTSCGGSSDEMLYICSRIDCPGRHEAFTISKTRLKYCREAQQKITESDLHSWRWK